MNELIEYSNSDIDLLIIEVLKKHSNENRRLTQVEIREFLMKEYKFTTTTRTLHTTMRRLTYIDENIKYDETEKGNGDIEYKNWWYKQTFSDGELCFLLDCVKYNKNILIKDKIDLCERLKKLSFTKELSSVKLDVSKEISDCEINPLYIENIEVINKAIKLEKQIRFNMQIYNIDKKYYEIDKVYTLVPEELVIKEGIYYLLARYENYKKYQFRIDKIKEVEMLSTPVLNTPIKYQSKDTKKYLDERVYMLSGEMEDIKLLIKDNYIIDKLVTDFNKTVTFTKTNENEIYATLKTNKKAFDVWIYKYKEMVEIKK